MPKISANVGVTLQITDPKRPDKREFFRGEMGIQEIDTELPLEPQIESAMKGLPAVFERITEALITQAGNFLRGGSPT